MKNWYYTIRHSARSKRIRLNFSPAQGLELVLPKAASVKEGKEFIASQSAWISEIETQYNLDLTRAPDGPEIPESITLKAIGKSYALLPGSRAGLVEKEGDLLLSADSTQSALLLQKWLTLTAKRVLAPWLLECSERTGLRYDYMNVRNQSSRWGSYSSRGGVSLNCRLLLLEPELVEYVLLHELSHSKHMNHSRAFWDLLESVCPNARELDRAVDVAAKQVPHWVRYKP